MHESTLRRLSSRMNFDQRLPRGFKGTIFRYEIYVRGSYCLPTYLVNKVCMLVKVKLKKSFRLLSGTL